MWSCLLKHKRLAKHWNKDSHSEIIIFIVFLFFACLPPRSPYTHLSCLRSIKSSCNGLNVAVFSQLKLNWQHLTTPFLKVWRIDFSSYGTFVLLPVWRKPWLVFSSFCQWWTCCTIHDSGQSIPLFLKVESNSSSHSCDCHWIVKQWHWLENMKMHGKTLVYFCYFVRLLCRQCWHYTFSIPVLHAYQSNKLYPHSINN